MTSPRTETTARPDDDTADKPQRSQLSAVQVTAGALAAVSSAVAMSFFGVAGTLIGAALASVISTVSAALYSESLNRTGQRLRRGRTQRPGASAEQPAPAAAPATRALPVQRPPAPGAAATPTTRVLPAHLDPRRPPVRRRACWVRVAAYAIGVFAIAMAVVTTVELVGQKPVSALVGGSDTSGTTTTIGALTNASSSRDSTPTSPDTTTPATPTDASATATPSEGSDGDDSVSEAPQTDSDDSGSATATPSRSATPTATDTDSSPSSTAPRSSAAPTRSSAGSPATSAPAQGTDSAP
ncbi:hypothetical protein DQ238_09210 [Geodermatophilus sp. TF02-6]|uniref:hypothetical protein n=1 Tax=Geodermatophilus sp. TF02-6 TaxID=2250575 RepID=UPI000DEAD454|nr:hypothetical protein [Geodermatophilus sp. TF02-6]RBY79809.1 hypothetical protein DQ238_09210 [Geodermatophilus sp. TF02-6]